MTTLDRLSLQCTDKMGFHLMSLSNVKPNDTMRAVVTYANGQQNEFDAPASHCFSAWDGYWSNFRLADYCGAMFPGSVSCCYLNQN